MHHAHGPMKTVSTKLRSRDSTEETQQEVPRWLAPDSTCGACKPGYVPKFRFETTQGVWEYHVALAKLQGCELASIHSAEEQAAAIEALRPYISFSYSPSWDFNGAFAYIGGKLDPARSDIEAGSYFFKWVDGSGYVSNTETQYSNFHDGDPNGDTSFYGKEPYLALSLDQNGSYGIERGLWVDFSSRQSPALYKCCMPSGAPDLSTCTVA